MLAPPGTLKGHCHREWCLVLLACEGPWRLWGKPTVVALCLKCHCQPASLWVQKRLSQPPLKEKAACNLSREKRPTLVRISEIITSQRGGKSTNFPLGSLDLNSRREPGLHESGLTLITPPHLCPLVSLKGLPLSCPGPCRPRPHRCSSLLAALRGSIHPPQRPWSLPSQMQL